MNAVIQCALSYIPKGWMSFLVHKILIGWQMFAVFVVFAVLKLVITHYFSWRKIMFEFWLSEKIFESEIAFDVLEELHVDYRSATVVSSVCVCVGVCMCVCVCVCVHVRVRACVRTGSLYLFITWNYLVISDPGNGGRGVFRHLSASGGFEPGSS